MAARCANIRITSCRTLCPLPHPDHSTAAILEQAFKQRFGSSPRLFRAPGRVNLIGDHTDYNAGLVLPLNTALYTWVAIAPRPDPLLQVYSSLFDETASFALDNPDANKNDGWGAYVQGLLEALREADINVQGANVLVSGDLPLGGGLSSSASLLVALASALLTHSGQDLPPRQLAQLCQLAEHRAVGVPCGIMDQFVIANGRSGAAMLLDCRNLEVQWADLPPELGLLVVDSGVKHALRDGGYARRREQCEQALNAMQAAGFAGATLRDLNAEQWTQYKTALSPEQLRRSHHVMTENQRVQDAAAALHAGDMETLGTLLNESHASLRDDFDVCCDELDYLAEAAHVTPGVYGARMFGGGFGGCIIALTSRDNLPAATRRIVNDYAEWSGHDPWYHVVQPAHPAGPVPT